MKERLDRLYLRYNVPDYIHPDPLELVLRYRDVEDREIAAMVASSLSFGRVSQILSTVSKILGPMGDSPRKYLENKGGSDFSNDYRGFVYRFVREEALVALLLGMKNALTRFGGLEACFINGMSHGETLVPAMGRFVGHLSSAGDTGYLLALPGKGSAMKRFNLFLRWMVRKDFVDPGGWGNIDPERLIVPLDTHMHRLALGMGLTQRRQGDMKTALEITEGFRVYSPEDPVKYDFVLTRFGIRPELDYSSCLDFLKNSE
jgi:uncharacterized protein (TIGR02757 family)